MARTYEPIASQTLGSSASTISFTSIAATWTDLRLILSHLHTATVVQSAGVRFNSDTGSNYSTTYLDGNGSAAISGRLTNETSLVISYRPSASAPSDVPVLALVDVQSYANSSVYKTALTAQASHFSSGGFVSRYVGLWRSTSAITSIDIISRGGGSFLSGTTASLYGIKAA